MTDSLIIIIMLVVSGIIVGVINTLAGGGAIISMTLFMVLGLPIGVANGTNRIAVVLQNLTSSLAFLRKRLLDIKSGIKLSIPAVIGNIVGSMVATHISDTVFTIFMAVVLTAGRIGSIIPVSPIKVISYSRDSESKAVGAAAYFL